LLCPESLAVWVSVAALRLAEGKGADELSVLGAVFTQLGDTLTTISAQKSMMDSAGKS